MPRVKYNWVQLIQIDLSSFWNRSYLLHSLLLNRIGLSPDLIGTKDFYLGHLLYSNNQNLCTFSSLHSTNHVELSLGSEWTSKHLKGRSGKCNSTLLSLKGRRPYLDPTRTCTEKDLADNKHNFCSILYCMWSL